MLQWPPYGLIGAVGLAPAGQLLQEVAEGTASWGGSLRGPGDSVRGPLEPALGAPGPVGACSSDRAQRGVDEARTTGAHPFPRLMTVLVSCPL